MEHDLTMRLMCCAPGCGWRAEYAEGAEPQRERGAGYTPLAKCPQCATPDAVHYGCEHADCWDRATSNPGYGWRCRPHKREMD